MVLPSSRHGDILSRPLRPSSGVNTRLHGLSLYAPSLVCRDTHKETELLPWCCNHIKINSDRDSYRTSWIERVSAEMRSAIRAMDFLETPTIGFDQAIHDTLSLIQESFPEIENVCICLWRLHSDFEFTALQREHVLGFARKHGWQVVFREDLEYD